jgi:hypothetical protein
MEMRNKMKKFLKILGLAILFMITAILAYEGFILIMNLIYRSFGVNGQMAIALLVSFVTAYLILKD